MTKFWFTADYHLGHEKIIEYETRPFGSLEQMDVSIIRNHNSRVKKEDVVFHIGDFCFSHKKSSGMKIVAADYENLLNGKMIFIRGNHDKKNGVKTIIKNVEITLGSLHAYLVHDPTQFNSNYKINLVGHVHKLWLDNKAAKNTVLINVGVDARGFKPMSMEEVLKEYFKIVKGEKLHG